MLERISGAASGISIVMATRAKVLERVAGTFDDCAGEGRQLGGEG